MAKLTAQRIETLKRNGGMDRFVDRPRSGRRLDLRWTMSRCGNCSIFYRPETSRWVMKVAGTATEHTIAGDSDLERINAHWEGFCRTNNRKSA